MVVGRVVVGRVVVGRMVVGRVVLSKKISRFSYSLNLLCSALPMRLLRQYLLIWASRL